MNLREIKSTSPLQLFRSITLNRELLYSLIKRDIAARYRGSFMGLLWTFLNPVLMLAVYTIVFSVVFKARWPGGTASKTEFALVLFSGLMVFNLFSECITKAPNLVLGNVNYVKKIIFPVEMLPVISLGVAFFHFGINVVVWLLFYIIFFGMPNITILMLPLAVVPLVLITLGASWFLASLGVYLRDVGQIIGLISTVLMFMSPVFYPVSALPEEYRQFMQLNPLTSIIEQTRDIMIWGKPIIWMNWLTHLTISVVIAWLGFAFFQKTRGGFADVL
ncbi:sugar ABC transporter permease [Serratia sp. S1B]|nr:sugar ABC transporter permease [Serratia sp. S1B]